MKQKGFTLIELLVTMGIIAVLTGMAVFNFNQSRERARDVQRKSDLGQLVKALELYKNDNNAFPLIVDDYPVPDETIFQQDLLTGGYIKKAFSDPKGTTWQNYKYLNAAVDDNMNYYLMACLENKADSTRANETQCQIFNNYQGSGRWCECGDAYSGVMYVVSNP